MQSPQHLTKFHTTIWTQIHQARTHPQILTDLIQTYWPPIYSFLKRKGHSEDQAAEITQAFICDRILDSSLLGRANKTKGKFRNYLLRSLQNYTIDEHKKEAARNRFIETELSNIDLNSLALSNPPEDHSPKQVFEKQWARSIFRTAIDRLEDSCIQSNQLLHWQAYTHVHPGVFSKGKTKRPANDEIAKIIGARDAAHVSILLNSIRRKFKKILTELIAETVESPEEIPDEINYLRSLLA